MTDTRGEGRPRAIHDNAVTSEDREWAKETWTTLTKAVEKEMLSEEYAILLLAKERTIWRLRAGDVGEEDVAVITLLEASEDE